MTSYKYQLESISYQKKSVFQIPTQFFLVEKLLTEKI